MSFRRDLRSASVWRTGCALAAIWLAQARSLAAPPNETRAGETLTSLEDLWALSETEQQRLHPVRLDYVVYYYDPAWQILWGRCGEAESYLSLDSSVLPIKAGQKIRVEGLLAPANKLRVEHARATVLEEASPLEALDTKGQVGEADKFNKRRVIVRGLVDRQSMSDPRHGELLIVSEGRRVKANVFMASDATALKLGNAVIEATGVYYSRTEAGKPLIELWVQSADDIRVTGTLDGDPRFGQPAVEISRLGEPAQRGPVHVAGIAEAIEPGSRLVVRDSSGAVTLLTPQLNPVNAGDSIEAVGLPVRREEGWALDEAIYRPAQRLVRCVHDYYQLGEEDRRKWQRGRMEMLVYYHDPLWGTLWGRSGGYSDYLHLGSVGVPIKTGDRILIEGAMPPTGTPEFANPVVTVLAENQPIELLSVRGQIGNADRFDKQMTEIEGYVDQQLNTDQNHIALGLVSEDRKVVVRLAIPPHEVMPDWEGALLRTRGVYSATNNPTGLRATIEQWVQGRDAIEVIGWLDRDKRFESVPITPIERLGELENGTLIHVSGVVRAQQPGNSLTIRDDTGQVTIQTAQAKPVPLGDHAEALGRVANRSGADVSLLAGLYRRIGGAGPESRDGLPKLRLAEQLRALTPEQAARSYPVQLSGVVTWADAKSDFFFARDASGGICIFKPGGFDKLLVVGERVDVQGTSAPGKFIPVALASEIRSLATVELPKPSVVTLEQALTGIEEAQWVSMSGYVRNVVWDGNWMRLELTTSAGEFAAVMPASQELENFRGSVVRVSGVCSALTNRNRQLTGVQMWVSSGRFVEVEEAAPADPFGVQARTIASLRQFGTLQMLNRRVRVSGVVIRQEPGRSVQIQEGNEGLLVLSPASEVLRPGDRIEAVGFPGRENSRVVLREAVYRRVSSGTEPAALRVAELGAIDPELDGRLVRIECTLLDMGAHELGAELINQQGAVIFGAQLRVLPGVTQVRWQPGSRLALTGVYQIEFDEYRRPRQVKLMLRSPQDVEVLQAPPWWTVRRILAVTGAVAVAGLLGLGWAMTLRRRVRLQTGVIADQIENEKAARLEAALARASKLESLGVLAGGIAHDFNNLLTVVIGNLSLAKLDVSPEAETWHCITESERAATRAKDLTQQLLTFAKGGEPMRTSTALPDVVREAAQFALHGAKVRCEFDLAPEIWPADVDRGQVGQVVNNLIINATQAMPAGGLIRIEMRNDEIAEPRQGLAAGRYVKTSFADNGSGITAENLPRIFEPYFTTKQQGSGLGLATVYSIVKKHRGHIEVSSQPGVGTTFHVWLPAATSAPEPAAVPAKSERTKTGRVLFMDDEPAIRTVGAAVLKRHGFHVTAVSDGADVVREYEAARAERRPFDLVILDLTVPGGVGGAEAIDRLREIDPGVRAIVASGYSSDPVMANYQSHGFAGRVPKPYQASDLVNAVDAVLRG